MVKRRILSIAIYSLIAVFCVAMWIIGEGGRKNTDDHDQEIAASTGKPYHRWMHSLWEPGPAADKLLYAAQGTLGFVAGGFCIYQLARAGKDNSK